MIKKLKSIFVRSLSIVLYFIILLQIKAFGPWKVNSLKLIGRTKVKARRAPITSLSCATVYDNVQDSTLEAIKEMP